MHKALVITCNAWNDDETGGAYKIATEFAIFCAEKGLDVHYVCSISEPEASVRVCSEKGVHIWRYPRPRLSGKEHSLINLYHHYHWAARTIGQVQARIGHSKDIILNGHTELQYLSALHTIGRSNISRSVMSVHSPLAEEYLANQSNVSNCVIRFAGANLLTWIERSCYKRSDIIQCDSLFTRLLIEKKVCKDIAGRIKICPAFVDLNRFSNMETLRSAARDGLKQIEWDPAAIYFFCLRRHIRRTGIDHLIRACSWLRKELAKDARQPSFQVIIGGDGPLRPEFESMVCQLNLNKQILFTGKIADEELPLFYRASDCSVVPSSALECFGLILLESMAAGTPIVATPVGAIPEVLGPFADQSLSKGADPESLGRAMLEFILNRRFQDCSVQLNQYVRQYEKSKILGQLFNLVTGESSQDEVVQR